MQSTSASTSQDDIDRSTLNSLDHKTPNNELIPDISSPSSYSQCAFQVTNKTDIIKEDTENITAIKCILLGDSKVGKSSLVISYTSNGFPDNHKSTAFDVYKVDITVEERRVQMQICDTGGGDEVSSLRNLAYQDCHTFILCFSVIDPSSFYHLIDHWYKEIESYVSMINAAVLLVGCRCDERNNVSHLIDLSAQGQGPITEQIVRQHVNKFRVDAYIECSSLTQKNLKRVFDLAIWYSVKVYDRCLVEEHRLAMHILSTKSNQHKKPKKKKPNPVKGDNGIQYNGNNGNNENDDNNNLVMNSPVLDVANKSSWKRFLCIS